MLKTQICVTRPQCVKLNLHILPNTKESSVGAKRSILMEKHAPFHVVSTYVRIFRNVTPVIHQHLLYCMQGRYISIYCTVCMADTSAFTVLYAWQIHQHLLYCMHGRYISIYCTVCMADTCWRSH